MIRSALTEFTALEMQKSSELPFVTKNSKYLVGYNVADDSSALIDFIPLVKDQSFKLLVTKKKFDWLFIGSKLIGVKTCIPHSLTH